MKKSRFTEEQIIAILREQEAGGKTADVCRGERDQPGCLISNTPAVLTECLRTSSRLRS